MMKKKKKKNNEQGTFDQLPCRGTESYLQCTLLRDDIYVKMPNAY